MARQQGLTEERIQQLTNPDSDALTPAERAALRFAAAFRAGRSPSPAEAAALSAFYDDAQCVELGTFIAINRGFIPMIRFWRGESSR